MKKTNIHPLAFALAMLLVATLACNLPDSDDPIPTKAPVEPEKSTQVFFYTFPDQATFNGEASVGSLLDFCLPPNTNGTGVLILSEFNSLNGNCTANDERDSVKRKGYLTGIYDQDQKTIQIQLETTRVFSTGAGTVTATLILTGEAPLNGGTASGNGDFTYTCTAAGQLTYCIDERTTLTLQGSMPFMLEFK